MPVASAMHTQIRDGAVIVQSFHTGGGVIIRNSVPAAMRFKQDGHGEQRKMRCSKLMATFSANSSGIPPPNRWVPGGGLPGQVATFPVRSRPLSLWFLQRTPNPAISIFY